MLIMPCGNDDDRDKADGESEAALKRSGQPYTIKEFSAMSHGFVLRGDVEDEAVARGVAEAMNLMVAHFTEHLS